MEQVRTVGLDTAKQAFQLHAATASGEVILQKKLRRHQVLAFFSALAPLSGSDGGLRRQSSLGARDRAARPRGQADRPAYVQPGPDPRIHTARGMQWPHSRPDTCQHPNHAPKPTEIFLLRSGTSTHVYDWEDRAR